MLSVNFPSVRTVSTCAIELAFPIFAAASPYFSVTSARDVVGSHRLPIADMATTGASIATI